MIVYPSACVLCWGDDHGSEDCPRLAAISPADNGEACDKGTIDNDDAMAGDWSGKDESDVGGTSRVRTGE